MVLGRTCPQCGAIFMGARCPTCAAPPAPAVPPPTLAPGQSFRGFEILEQLGQGGMGIVFKARQSSVLERVVALKILHVGRERGEEFQSRFDREAKILAALCHPHIVTIFDYGREGDLFFFSMEYVEGITLGDRIQQSRLSIDEAIRITEQVCDGLAFAHERGVVHRDIKPANLLLDGRGQVKIADFGVAKLLADDAPVLTASGAAVGTFLYMAPEQARHCGHVDPRVDIYALGVTLYEMLTGQLPGGRFEPPSKLGVGNERLDEAVLKAMERDPAKRYASVTEMAEALRPFLGASAEKTELRPAEKPARRYTLILAAAVMLVLGTILAVILWPKRRPDPVAENPTAAPLRFSYALRHEVALPSGPEIRSLIFDPTGGTLYVETPLKIQRIDAARGSLMAEWDVSGPPLYRMALSPDGTILGGTGGTDVQLSRTDTGQRTHVLDPQMTRVRGFAFSPDGLRVAITGVLGTSVMEIENRREILRIPGDAFAVAYHPNGTRVAIATKDGRIRLCDAEKGTAFHSFQAPAEPVRNLAFRSDGAILACGGGDGTIVLWDVRIGEVVRTLKSDDGVTGIAFSPESLLLASTTGALTLWDPDRGERLQVRGGEFKCVAVSRDGKRVAAGGSNGSVYLWERKE